jgi:hypothetical protein
LTAVLTGLGLAAAAGLNAWAVLLLFNGLFRLLPQEFPGPLASFLASPLVLQIAIVLFLAEFVVDKIPFLDHYWDLGHTLLRPAAGVLLALACVPATTLAARFAVGIGAALVTLATHIAKSTTRLTSTAATRGLTQVAVSLAEDFVAVVLATLVFFVPWMAGLLLAGLLFLLATHRHRVYRALQVLFFQLQHPRRRPQAAA